MPTDAPLVSAIMPTRGRHGWAADAVRMFQAQTWPNKELVIIDDRSDPSFQQGLKLPDVQYFIAPRFPIGGKRNMAVARASADIILHWDSDDLYTPDRMEHQANLLLSNDVELTGYNVMPFVDADSGERYIYHGLPGYCIGVSLCYWRETWEARAFPSVEQDEDNQFIAGRRLLAVDSGGRITARIHRGNTCDKREGIARDPERWERVA